MQPITKEFKMQIVQIQQDDNNGFVCVVPASVHVIPVTDIDEANKVLPFLVKGQLKKLDIEFEPIADGKHRDTDSNEAIDDAECDFYYINPLTEPSNTKAVAEIAIGETPIQITWFLVP
jgi:hypothetical protein